MAHRMRDCSRNIGDGEHPRKAVLRPSLDESRQRAIRKSNDMHGIVENVLVGNLAIPKQKAFVAVQLRNNLVMPQFEIS